MLRPRTKQYFPGGPPTLVWLSVVASAAVLVPFCTSSTFRIIAIKKSPTLSVRLRSGSISTPGTFCTLSHSPGTLPRANQQSAGLLVPALRCYLTSCGARIGRRPLGRGLSSATAAPATAPCFRRRRRSPPQLFSSSDGAQAAATSRIIAIKKEPYVFRKAV